MQEAIDNSYNMRSRFPPQVRVVQPTNMVSGHQAVQQLRVSEAEVDELKQSLRYVEIQLAKSQEDKEALENRLKNLNDELGTNQTNLANQLASNKQKDVQIKHLQAKIDGFSHNQSALVEKSRFKASSYMSEINQREEELGRVRSNLVDAQEENKWLTVTREKFREQNEFLAKELKQMEQEYEVQKRKMEEQQRLIDSLCVTSKIKNPSLTTGGTGAQEELMAKAAEEAQRNERIAAGANRSTFLHLGEKRTKLVSESESSLLQRQNLSTRSSVNEKPAQYMSEAQRKDQVYINDESVPAQIFPLIEAYRAKMQDPRTAKGALMIDDFFGEAHAIMKDTHLKEIARIRNENNVEIMKLKKNLEERLMKEGLTRGQVSGSFDGRAKDNLNAFNVKDVFADNEAERQRRLLNEENETLKKRLRAVETIAQSGNLERAKFMEGASWLANKSLQEANKHSQKLLYLVNEFDRRANACITDPAISEIDGPAFFKVRDWIEETVSKESNEVQQRFQTLLENVNYNLGQANRNFNK